jgi:predicted XRE-type DNA-binding protein
MKISNVVANTRKKSFEVRSTRGLHEVPFAKLRLVPSSRDRVAEVYVDSELGDEAFTYRLESGEEDTIHLDSVLELTADPEYLQDLLLHKLTVEARKGLEASGLSKRQVARQLGTSPSQLYRLLDPENPRHSVGQLLALLDLVGKEVDFVVRPRSTKRSERRVPAGDRRRDRPSG